MGKRLTILILITIVLAGLAGVYVAGGLSAYSRFQQNSVASQQHCGGQSPVRICVRAPSTVFSAFYPSYVTTQYPLISLEYSSSSSLTLVMAVDIAGFSQVQKRTVNATTTMQTVSFVPPLLGSELRSFTNELNTSLQVRVTDTQGHPYYVNDTPLVLHSRWLMQWVATNRLQLAAWITPNDAAITTLISKARARLAVQPPPAPTAMTGYAQASSRQVIDQVDAIYDTIRIDYHIHYVQESVPYNGSGDSNAVTQNIKLPAEILQQQSGMCVELTVLLASAVERIGLHAEIVIIPGHAFLGVAVTPDSKHFEYWDAVQVNDNIAGDSANIATDAVYAEHVKQRTIVDTILISDARRAFIQPMV